MIAIPTRHSVPPNDIEPLRLHPIHRPSQEKRQNNEHAAIRGIDPAKVGCLKCRNDAVEMRMAAPAIP